MANVKTAYDDRKQANTFLSHAPVVNDTKYPKFDYHETVSHVMQLASDGQCCVFGDSYVSLRVVDAT